MATGAEQWAREEFSAAALGDERRTARLVRIASIVARRPAGRISDVFPAAADRQAAYDFVEHSAVSAAKVSAAVGEATARRAWSIAAAFIVLDGTSLSLTDIGGAKPFGSIGSRARGARGLKVLNAYAIEPSGAPLGIAAQIWWRRLEAADKYRYRPVDARESRHWRDAAECVAERFAKHARATRLHFLADREADASAFMLELHAAGHDFTIRANATRAVEFGGRRVELRKILPRLRVVASARVDVRANGQRRERVARMVIHAARVVVLMRDHHVKETRPLELSVVWAHEVGTTPRGERPLDWVLYTTWAVRSGADARQVVRNYSLRWRVEDFHRTWKNGHCQTEQTQLRTADAVIKWATILAAVAARAERLRHRARQAPDDLAETEFSADEIDALLFLKKQEKRRNEIVPERGPVPLAQAVRWVADLGGYTGKSSGGPPGATTIGRGLQRVVDAAEIFAGLRRSGKLR